MANVSEMFGGIKSKLGLGGRAVEPEYEEYDEFEEEEYDDYEDYDDYDDGYTTRGGYGNRNTVTTRSAGTSTPRLVSYNDVRDSSISSSFSRNSSRIGSAGRTMMDSSLPRSMTPEGAADISAAGTRKHIGGLDSLFSTNSQRLAEAGGSAASSIGSSIGTSIGNMSRGLRVVRPTEYSQVADVARMLRAGDAVVLVFTSTSESLEKRLLDFSFGVASALDASVDCIASKVFAITVGAALTETEKSNLRTQGILK